MKLNESEKIIFAMLKGGKEIGIEELLKRAGIKKTATRHSMTVRMKYFSAKVAPHGWIVENLSGIGRGAKASYKMVKMF